jgi:hypothetical protein
MPERLSDVRNVAILKGSIVNMLIGITVLKSQHLYQWHTNIFKILPFGVADQIVTLKRI